VLEFKITEVQRTCRGRSIGKVPNRNVKNKRNYSLMLPPTNKTTCFAPHIDKTTNLAHSQHKRAAANHGRNCLGREKREKVPFNDKGVVPNVKVTSKSIQRSCKTTVTEDIHDMNF
jgi:hypothetical protein